MLLYTSGGIRYRIMTGRMVIMMQAIMKPFHLAVTFAKY